MCISLIRHFSQGLSWLRRPFIIADFAKDADVFFVFFFFNFSRWHSPAPRFGGLQRLALPFPVWRKAMRMPWKSITRSKWPSSILSSPCSLDISQRVTGRRSWPFVPLMYMPEMWWPRWLLKRFVVLNKQQHPPAVFFMIIMVSFKKIIWRNCSPWLWNCFQREPLFSVFHFLFPG